MGLFNTLPVGLSPNSSFEDQMTVIQDYLCGDIHKGNATANPLLILGHLLQPNPATGPGTCTYSTTVFINK